MAGNPDTQDATRPGADVARALGAVSPLFATFGRNVRDTRTFLAGRRRDRRFAIQPYGLPAVANAVALAATAFALLVIVVDPHLPGWQESLPHRVDRFFGFLTQFGKSDWILIATGLAVIITLFMNAAAMRARERARSAIRAMAAAYVFIAVALAGIVANLAKYTIGRARPKLFADNGSFAFDFWSWDPDWAALPSGHATTGMALGVALALLFPRLRWVFLCLGFWIAASRPLIGVHYPSDMLAGGLLGGTTAWLIARAFARLRLVFGFDAEGRLTRRQGASGRLA